MSRPPSTSLQPAMGALPAEPRAEQIAKSLRVVARRARTPRGIMVSSGTAPDSVWQRIFVWAIVASFLVIVAVPNVLSGVYLGFIASDQYATETRFALRGSETSVIDPLGGLFGMNTANRIQDSLIVTDYVRSRTMVEAVDQAVGLRRMFSADGIDFLSRFDPARPEEDLVRYWRRHVEATIDSYSGIITVVVRAFTPQDSLLLANEIAKHSEAMVNELTGRSRSDALRQASAEIERAKQNLQVKAAALRDVRNAEGILDTAKTSEAATRMLTDLRLELARMEQDYGAQRLALSPEAPQMRVLAARIQSMRDQIRGVERDMTGARGKDGPLSTAFSRFDVAQLESKVAEQQYVAAATAYERARVELESQTTYLASFLKPVMAQKALYPKRWLLALVIALLTLSLWGAGVGIAVTVRNHVAV